MPTSILILVIAVLAVVGYFAGRSRAHGVAGRHTSTLHSLPSYYGFYVAIWCGIPALLLALGWIRRIPVDHQDLGS